MTKSGIGFSFRQIQNYGELDAYEMVSGKHRAIFSRFGGQLIAWEYDSVSILFENPKADLSRKSPYRGGAPICFAAFGDGKFIDGQKHEPSHGEARISVWSIPSVQSSGDGQLVTLNAIVNSVSGVPLQIYSTYKFKTDSLEITFEVKNIGVEKTAFQLAFHSYFHGDPSKAEVSGIGEKYLDANDEFKSKVGGLGLSESTKVNRIYSSPETQVNLKINSYQLMISNSNFPEVVIWNPGQSHTFKDLGDPHFLCVESGLILDPVSIAPNSTWRGQTSYKINYPK